MLRKILFMAIIALVITMQVSDCMAASAKKPMELRVTSYISERSPIGQALKAFH